MAEEKLNTPSADADAPAAKGGKAAAEPKPAKGKKAAEIGRAHV